MLLGWVQTLMQPSFGSPIRSQKLRELAKLRQNGSTVDHHKRFAQLVLWVGTLSQAWKFEHFISGFADYIVIEVELHNPLDLAITMSIFQRTQGTTPLFAIVICMLIKYNVFLTSTTHRNLWRNWPDLRWIKQAIRDSISKFDELFPLVHQSNKLFWIDSIGDEEEFARNASTFHT